MSDQHGTQAAGIDVARLAQVEHHVAVALLVGEDQFAFQLGRTQGVQLLHFGGHDDHLLTLVDFKFHVANLYRPKIGQSSEPPNRPASR